MQNIFDFRDTVIDEYESYSRSFVTIRAEDINAQIEAEYKDGRYWPDPLIQINPGYKRCETVQQLSSQGLLHPQCAEIFKLGKSEGAPCDMTLYKHQLDAIAKARQKRSYVLTTGTGSGKSMAFATNLMRRRSPRWLMGFRNICRSTDERTVISCAIPVAGVGHSMPLIDVQCSPLLRANLLGIFSSIVFDYFARQKIGGTNLTFGYLKQFPLPSPKQYSSADLAFIVPKVFELTYTATDMRSWAEEIINSAQGEVRVSLFVIMCQNPTVKGIFAGWHPEACVGEPSDSSYNSTTICDIMPDLLRPFPFDPERRAFLRAELDAYYAILYGLTRDDLIYILDPAEAMGEDYPSETFRVLKNNDIKEFGEYRTRRLVLAAYDLLVQIKDTQ